MHFLAKTMVSRYSGVSSYIGEVSLHTELMNIKNGIYRQPITKCRELFRQSKETYNMMKKKLLSITISGVFDKTRKMEYLTKYTNLIVFDLDHIENISEIDALKRQLFCDDYVCACWVSPSGEGIKFIIKTLGRSSDHKYIFDSAKRHYETKLNREIDSSGSDITRLCFISDDSDLLLKNEEPKLYISNSNVLYSQTSGQLHATDSDMNKMITTSQSVRITDSIKRKELYSTGGKNNSSDRKKIEKIIKFLKKRNLSITDSYEKWYKAAIAIANTFSFDVGEKLYLRLCELDKDKHNEAHSKHILEYCYLHKHVNKPITFGTIIYFAEQAGFDLKRCKR